MESWAACWNKHLGTAFELMLGEVKVTGTSSGNTPSFGMDRLQGEQVFVAASAAATQAQRQPSSLQYLDIVKTS